MREFLPYAPTHERNKFKPLNLPWS